MMGLAVLGVRYYNEEKTPQNLLQQKKVPLNWPQ